MIIGSLSLSRRPTRARSISFFFGRSADTERETTVAFQMSHVAFDFPVRAIGEKSHAGDAKGQPDVHERVLERVSSAPGESLRRHSANSRLFHVCFASRARASGFTRGRIKIFICSTLETRARTSSAAAVFSAQIIRETPNCAASNVPRYRDDEGLAIVPFEGTRLIYFDSRHENVVEFLPAHIVLMRCVCPTRMASNELSWHKQPWNKNVIMSANARASSDRKWDKL